MLGLYDVLNLKLDKTGGLTEALRLYAEIRKFNNNTNVTHESKQKKIMTGCMVCSSLSIAPALATIARVSDYVDLDGPALLARDCDFGIEYTHGGGRIKCKFSAELWG